MVDEIVAAGGQAVAHLGDASSLDDAKAMISLAIDTFGGLDVVVNNAGILRDRMLFSMAEEEWDAVIKVHMKGTWASSRVAAEYWRNRSKEGLANDARLINTTSVSGIYGNPGQTNYGAAKAGIATFTLIAAGRTRSLRRYVQCSGARCSHPTHRRSRHAARDARALRARMGRAGDHVAGVVSVIRRDRSGDRVERSATGHRSRLDPRRTSPTRPSIRTRWMPPSARSSPGPPPGRRCPTSTDHTSR